MAQPTTKNGIPLTPRNYEAYDGKLDLICRSCGGRGRYSVGRIFVDPKTAYRSAQGLAAHEDAVFFSGYFRCRKCDGRGPWEFTKSTRARLQLLEMLALTKGSSPIQFGALQLFDGTPIHSASEAEAHLLKLVEADPSNYFLWSRLGNLFSTAELPHEALPAFQKAVELNPCDVESHHSLAEIYYGQGNLEQAAEHYQQVLLHAREAPPRSLEKPELLKVIVRDALEALLELNQRTKGKIDFLPKAPPDKIVPNERGEVVVVLKDYDLSREEDWEALTQSFLGMPPALARSAPIPTRRESFVPAHRLSETPVGRNHPCPCGSGKKFKKCCGN